MIPAQGCVKNYHWGKVGNESYIAKFQAINSSTLSNGQQKSKDKTPLAELWFGTHPSGPTTVFVDNQLIRLDSFLSKQPEMVGNIEHFLKYNKKLPFLLKLLSVDQPLSLQAHPDRKLAEILHRQDANNYPDSNHKPELAIALTDFEVLCDFRPTKEIAHFMLILEPFRVTIGEDNCQQYISSVHEPEAVRRLKLADCFKSLMTCEPETVKKATKNLITLVESTNNDNNNVLLTQELFELILKLDSLYPGDPGVFAPFFLNYMKLKPGQAIYLKANKLHAYIKGECIECMSSSDNVVRAGLTTKFRDVETLIKMLNYESVKEAQEVIFEGAKLNSDPTMTTYAPTNEFKIDKFIITNKNAPNSDYTLKSVSSGSFFLVLGGKASTKDFFNLKLEHKLSLGSSGFVPPKIALRLYNIQAPLTIFRAYC